MEPNIRSSLWTSLLQADQEQRYWHQKACEYVRWDFWTKVFLAIVTSSAVGGWAIWSQYPYIWKSLTVVSSLMSIVMPFLSLNDKVLSMTEVHGKWLQLLHDYEAMWRDQEVLDDSSVRAQLDAGKKVESELSAKAISLPGADRTLGANTYAQVIKDRT